MADGILEIAKALREMYESGNIKMLVFFIVLFVISIIATVLLGALLSSKLEEQKEKEYEYNKSIVDNLQMLKDKVKELEGKEKANEKDNDKH